MENQRVRLSKQLLRNSLISLLKSKTIYKVSIKEICENAGVNRSTFYKYYGSEFDLLKDIENEYLETIEEYLNVVDIEYTILKLLTYVENNHDVFKIFLDDTPENHFYERMIQMSFDKMAFNESFAKLEGKVKKEYLYQFITFGALNLVKEWISKDTRETPEEMNKFLFELLSLFMK